MTACHDDGGGAVAVAGMARIALVGSPNAGKTSIFNHLTGLRAKIANYPGVTVGLGVGVAKAGDVEVAVQDLPGTYSLDPISPDEQVVADLLAGEIGDAGGPDAIVLVADATTLHRSILLVAQVLRLDLPCLLALSMTDELTARGGGIDVDALSTALGIPVVAVVANRGVGIDTMRGELASFDRWQRPRSCRRLTTTPSGPGVARCWMRPVMLRHNRIGARGVSTRWCCTRCGAPPSSSR